MIGDEPEDTWNDFKQKTTIKKPYMDHFKKFYCDTSTLGFSPDVLKVVVDFFGEDHVLFGTDAPLSGKGGEVGIQNSRDSVEALDLHMAGMRKIFSENIKGLINLT